MGAEAPIFFKGIESAQTLHIEASHDHQDHRVQVPTTEEPGHHYHQVFCGHTFHHPPPAVEPMFNSKDFLQSWTVWKDFNLYMPLRPSEFFMVAGAIISDKLPSAKH